MNGKALFPTGRATRPSPQMTVQMPNSARANLIDNRYVIRKGHFIINGDNVSLSMRMSNGNIDCHHVVGHLDSQCPDAIILQKFDKAVGGIATKRGWNYLKFPVWHFTKLPPQAKGTENFLPPAHSSSAMIARTDADCHGNVVDGDQLQTDLDVSPRTAAVYHGPISYQLAEALSDLDELFGRETRFFERYHAACITIEADKHISDDFFFTAHSARAALAARDLLPSTHANILMCQHCTSPFTNFPVTPTSQLVMISELSPRRFKKLMFTASVFVLEKLRQRPLTRFSQLRGELASMFALSVDFACGLLCRMLPQSSIIGLNKCAFAHAKNIDAEGRVVLDVELTLRDVFLGEDRIFGKTVDNKTIVARGSDLDDVCVILERQETLHVVGVRQKSSTDSVDSAFKPVQDAGHLIVGSSKEENLLRRMSALSSYKLKETVSLTSSVQRALRVLCSFCDSHVEKDSESDKDKISFYRSVFQNIRYVVSPKGLNKVLRTAMASGMLEDSDEAKVEKVMRSIQGMVWARVTRKVVTDIYMTKSQRQDKNEDSDVNGARESDMLVYVSNGETFVQECEPQGDAVVFSSPDEVRVAALIRGGFALGMRIERPAGTIITEGNGRDCMILTVGDDIMRLATQSTFGDGTLLMNLQS